jgi:hypothetical protein
MIMPSHMPSYTSSNGPSNLPSYGPSDRPSDVFSTVPSLAPTQSPEESLCIAFGYILENQAGLTADDIWTGNGNDVMTGLLVATRNTTIEILNETFPEIISPANYSDVRRHRRLEGAPRAFELAIADARGSEKANIILGTFENELDAWSRVRSSHRLLTMFLRRCRQRRLVFYTDDSPAQILRILDNPFCPRGEEDGVTLCSIVETQVCVKLEEEDDPAQVEAALISGFRESINSGKFFDAIPPEYIP